MEIQPISLFERWFDRERAASRAALPSACCLSTQGTDGFPNARFVSLKEIVDDHFIITTSLLSKKGIEIAALNKVALTFWWATTQKQVRVQGVATQIPEPQAEKYFNERSSDSQIVSNISTQGKEIDKPQTLEEVFARVKSAKSKQKLTRPKDWGGYAIAPVRMEFLEFAPTRLHRRKLFERIDQQWTSRYIQP